MSSELEEVDGSWAPEISALVRIGMSVRPSFGRLQEILSGPFLRIQLFIISARAPVLSLRLILSPSLIIIVFAIGVPGSLYQSQMGKSRKWESRIIEFAQRVPSVAIRRRRQPCENMDVERATISREIRCCRRSGSSKSLMCE